MNRKWLAFGSLMSLVLVAVFGTVLAAEDTASEQTEIANATEALTSDAVAQANEADTQCLATHQQLNQIDAELCALREQRIHDTILANLESYGLTDEQIMEIDEIMALIQDLQTNIRETQRTLMENQTNCSELHAQLEPLMTQLSELQGELSDLLTQYGIECCEPPNEVPGCQRRPGMRMGHGARHMPEGPRFQDTCFGPEFSQSCP